MARTVVPVNAPGLTGADYSALTVASGDVTNGMTVPNWNGSMTLKLSNPTGGSLTWTIRQRQCPTCGITTDRTIITAAGVTDREIRGLTPNLFQQADGGLYVDVSALGGTIGALAAA